LFDQTIIVFVRIAIPIFLMIVFIQSGLDKIIDKAGNLDWLKEHFSNTFLKNIIPHLLIILTILEIMSGLLFFVGIIFYMIFDQSQYIIFGLIISNITILCLFFGQRVAKDYVAAADLVNYFTLSVIGLLVFLY
tara:strand:+ start:1154 stop:1555 length:402 start_codon:yes stop_codon:yes gene_type:complete